MRIIIIEDEQPALEKLERYILKYDASITVVARLSGVTQTVDWIGSTKNEFDLAFMDIQLSDGLSFDIFNQIKLDKPIIFVTAFDEYAIDAFKVNSIDYILKPITFTEVSKALGKFKRMRTSLTSETIKTVTETIEKKRYKDRFLVRMGNHIHSIKTEEIALFYAEGRTVFLVTNTDKKYILDYRLEDLVSLLQPTDFLRVNRTYIMNLNAIKDVIMYSNSRLKITATVSTEKDIIVSRERVAAFKKWFEGS